ncbi:hypothetical protein FHS13_001450 [Nocardiopsis algeriensis]|uniref:Uncharacterized protein n=1 Tax=Nocardiopsis algeriensis TaxID=1478215 RepID=A0A841ITB8_9ACTN|nr:hypothetical protein [Nocardiopsis algeriensis]
MPGLPPFFTVFAFPGWREAIGAREGSVRTAVVATVVHTVFCTAAVPVSQRVRPVEPRCEVGPKGPSTGRSWTRKPIAVTKTIEEKT